jgi:putative membrane-bound dehydrogenase-like protein
MYPTMRPRTRSPLRFGLLLLAALLPLLAAAGDPPPPAAPPKGPLTPTEERATFRLAQGFRVELVAAEPDVIDPVAMTFDEDGRIYVSEMRGYPNGGIATGTITSGRIKVLEDRDGDGYYETSHVLADGLRFPTGLQPWRGGLIAAVAPNLIYFEDARGEGQARHRRVLYTGFDLANIQQLVNSLQWGLDNWVHACAGSAGGTIRSAERPEVPAVTLHGRGIRFRPGEPGSLEPTSGGGQYGLAPDEWERWFTASNSEHLRHVVLPDHYLRRNPALAVPAVTLDIPDHGPACKVYRISPFEPWRVERTRRRKSGPDAHRFRSTELVPGGFVTSACSPVVYAADAFPQEYRGNSFVCDPANNLVHRDVLVPAGATFVARRAPGEESREFLASTDTWFRPVHLTLGPDGALYLLDFYREVIETPLSLPDDIKAKLNLQSRGRGRIWRIVADTPAAREQSRRRPALSKATTRQLVEHLADGNLWWRLTAQRLLVERQDRAAVASLEQMAERSASAVGRAHALWTLDGLGGLPDEAVERALKDPEPGLREQALRLADGRLASARVRAAAVALADDPSPRVCFQLAFTLGQGKGPDLLHALTKLARRDGADRWTQTAILSSAADTAPHLLEALAGDSSFTAHAGSGRLRLLGRLAELVGARADDAALARVLAHLGAGDDAPAWQVAVLDGLGEGLQEGGRSPSRLWEEPPASLRQPVTRARAVFDRAAAAGRDEKRPLAERVAAVALLGRGPFAPLEAAAADLLAPQSPPQLQLAAVRALSAHTKQAVAGLLLAGWPSYGPSIRREVAEAIFARPQRVARLLDAIERKDVSPAQLDPARLEQLRRLPDVAARERARRLLAGLVAPDRRQVVERYRDALDLPAEAARGRAVFRKNCTVCHRLEGEGYEVGPDLLSALRNKSPEQLLTDILDPSREVDPRYLNYVVTTRQGRTYSGLIAAETATSLTLRRGERAEDTVLRSQVEEVQATTKSLMPEGLETQLGKQDVADLIAYLRRAALPR